MIAVSVSPSFCLSRFLSLSLSFLLQAPPELTEDEKRERVRGEILAKGVFKNTPLERETLRTSVPSGGGYQATGYQATAFASRLGGCLLVTWIGSLACVHVEMLTLGYGRASAGRGRTWKSFDKVSLAFNDLHRRPGGRGATFT